MGDQEDREPELAVEPLQQGEDRLRGPGVERGRGLVGEEHGRLAGERPGDADTLLLPAGELRGVRLGLVGEADEVEQLTDPARPLPPRHAHDLQREGHVPRDRAGRQQREVLVDHADAHAGPAQLPLRQRGQLLPVDRDGARGGLFEQVDAAQQGALARAALAEHAEDLSFADMEVHAVEGDDGPVDLAQAGNSDHEIPRRRRRCSRDGSGIPFSACRAGREGG